MKAFDKRKDSNQNLVIQNQTKKPDRSAFLNDNRAKTVLVKNEETAIQHKVPGINTTQLSRKQQRLAAASSGAKGALVGSVGGYLIPGLGAIGGGLIGGLYGAYRGYSNYRPTLLSNLQKKDYQNELRVFQDYQLENKNAETEYQQGTIIKYTSSNSNRFTALLHQGQVLYTYDQNSQLKIGSNVGGIKHAIVAKDKDVKAAGMADVEPTRAQYNKGEYIKAKRLAGNAELTINKLEQKVKKIMLKLDAKSTYEAAQKANGNELEIINDYVNALDVLKLYTKEMNHFSKLKQEDLVVSKRNKVNLDNKSGHYHPDKDSKDEAFEAWNDAGFNNLSWKTF
jgi:hypothetical protein